MIAVYVRVWLILMALLAVTVAVAYVHLGPFNLALNLGIAGIKASLVMLFFMQLRTAGTVLRLAASVGLIWLLLLISLSLADTLTRVPVAPPW